MLIDFARTDLTAPIRADVCVVGAGPAGLSVVEALCGSDLSVCLLEGGGSSREKAGQRLYQGENIGLPYFKLHKTRLRQFGGTANHWTGRCVPLDAIDFAERDWIPYSGWPFPKSELDPWYEGAQRICNLGPMIYDERAWEFLGIQAPALDPERIRTDFWQFCHPTPRFSLREKPAVWQSPNVSALLHANVCSIRLNESATAVDHLVIAGPQGRRAKVEARAYVLACGGIETPRLLLASNDVQTAGIGNDRDLVGRFFMEHPKGVAGYVETSRPRELLDVYRKHLRKGGGAFWPSLRLPPELQEKERTLNTSVALYYEFAPGSGAAAIRQTYDDLTAGRRPQGMLRRVGQILGDLDVPLRILYQYFVERRPPLISPGRLYFLSRAEQAPNPESRVTLGAECDALGMPRVRLNWQVSCLDKHSLAALIRVLSQEFERLGLGCVRTADWLTDGTPRWPDILGGHHHMGTTRMSDDPAQGVVDRNCRVHGNTNLYIAGSSVFPTGGWANPTLTIVAMSLRLADHLRNSLA